MRSVGGDPACSVPFLERLRRARNASPVSDDHDRLERQGPQVACAPGSDTPVREAESFGPAHESEGSLTASRSGGKASHWGAEPLFKPGVALPGSIDHSISCVPAPAIAEVCFGRPGCALNRPTWSPIKAVPLAFPLSAQLSLSGNDFLGYFGRSFGRLRHHPAQHFWWGGLEMAGPGCYDAVAIARAAGFRMLVMSPHPSCGDCPLTARSRTKRAAKISQKNRCRTTIAERMWKR